MSFCTTVSSVTTFSESGGGFWPLQSIFQLILRVTERLVKFSISKSSCMTSTLPNTSLRDHKNHTQRAAKIKDQTPFYCITFIKHTTGNRKASVCCNELVWIMFNYSARHLGKQRHATLQLFLQIFLRCNIFIKAHTCEVL